MAVGPLLLLTGCGALGSARQTCREAGVPDAFINTLFIAVDTIREEGMSKGAALDSVMVGCSEGADGDLDAIMKCANCAAAVVDEVYP